MVQAHRHRPQTVEQLCELAMAHATRTYRDTETGDPTGHDYNWKYAMRAMLALFPDHDPATLEAPDFQEMQDWNVDLGTLKRSSINRDLRNLKTIMKWASKRNRGYIPKAVYHECLEIEPFKLGQCPAGESAKKQTATETQIETVMAFAPTLYLRMMIEIHMLTGMRSSELVKMRRSWIKPIAGEGGLLLYEPTQHKTRHHGKERQIVLGPRATTTLNEHLQRMPAEQDRLWPITVSTSYYQAMRRTCKVAKMPERVTPLMIRRFTASKIRNRDGLDAAQLQLGHANASTTEIYAPPDLTKAIQAMKRHG